MHRLGPAIESIPGVCEVDLVAGPAADPAAAPDLLVEVPHGATRHEHFEAVRSKLSSSLPAGLAAFFFVNTDVGAPECAAEVARLVAAAGAGSRKALVVRGLVPRTFIDCNRMLDGEREDYRASGFTPALPEYVTTPADIDLLHGLYRRYQEVARQAFAQVCGTGGSAVILHTYAPRSVDIQRVDADIVRALREAYEPERWVTWPERPAVDVISGAADGTRLAPAALIEAVRRRYAAAGVRVEENATYRLHPKTMGHKHSVDWPGGVLCAEINRGLLADPFTPFAEMRIGTAHVARMAAPLAAAWIDWREAAEGR